MLIVVQVREGGIRAFYKGLAPVTLRAGIGNSVSIFIDICVWLCKLISV